MWPQLPIKFNENFYKTSMQPAMLYDTKCWAINKQTIHKISVAEMRMLRSISRNINGSDGNITFKMRKFT